MWLARPLCFCAFLTAPVRRVLVPPLDLHAPSYEHVTQHFLSVEDLVFYYGDRPYLSAKETRALYHALLPTYYPSYLHDHDPDDVARMAVAARTAARAYARQRSYFYVRWASVLFDAARKLFSKKKKEHATALDVLAASCRTNSRVDRLCGIQKKMSLKE